MAPLSVPIAEMMVDLKYPVASGIQEKLEIAGWRLYFAGESQVPGLELQGWELVVENDRHGMPTSFRVKTRPEDLVLLKTRYPDLHKLAGHQIR